MSNVINNLNKLNKSFEPSNYLASEIIDFHNIVNRVASFFNESKEEAINRLIKTMKIEPKDILNDEDKYKIEVLMSK